MIGIFKSIHKLVKKTSSLCNNELTDIDLTMAQARILMILNRNEEFLIQREIACAAYVEPTTISRVIDGMVDKGLVKRSSHEESRRSNLIEITSLGRKKAIQSEEKFKMVEKKLFINFTQDEKDIFVGLMNRMAEEEVLDD